MIDRPGRGLLRRGAGGGGARGGAGGGGRGGGGGGSGGAWGGGGGASDRPAGGGAAGGGAGGRAPGGGRGGGARGGAERVIGGFPSAGHGGQCPRKGGAPEKVDRTHTYMEGGMGSCSFKRRLFARTARRAARPPGASARSRAPRSGVFSSSSWRLRIECKSWQETAHPIRPQSTARRSGGSGTLQPVAHAFPIGGKGRGFDPDQWHACVVQAAQHGKQLLRGGAGVIGHAPQDGSGRGHAQRRPGVDGHRGG